MRPRHAALSLSLSLSSPLIKLIGLLPASARTSPGIVNLLSEDLEGSNIFLGKLVTDSSTLNRVRNAYLRGVRLTLRKLLHPLRSWIFLPL